jgi:MscS family membrane protein
MLNALIQDETSYFSQLHGWGVFLLKLSTLFALGLILTFVILYGLRSLIRLMERNSSPWAGLVLNALFKPVIAEIWFWILLGWIRLSVTFFKLSFSLSWMDYVFELSILLGCVWFCVGLIGRICDRWLAQYQASEEASSGELSLDPTSILVIRRIGLIGVSLIAVLIGLGILNIPLSGLLTFGGISGAALAFASQSMIANFFGGLFIYFDRPFVIGDWISSPEKNLEGHVEHIGWRLTLIRSLDKRPIYVPNSVFTSTIIVNPSRMTYRRMNQNITIEYEHAEKMPQIMEKVREILREESKIEKNQIVVSLVQEGALNNSGITFNFSAFTKVTESVKFKLMQDRILLQIEAMIRELGAKISTLTE